jgi:2-aminoadipate transaminase
MQRMTSSAIRDLLKYTLQPGMISFAGGMPAPELFPLERFREAANRVLAEPASGRSALQYGITEGFVPLREMIVRHAARYGLQAGLENVLITSGSQQALDLIGKLLIGRADRVLVEAPTYLGALQAFDAYEAEYLALPADEAGLAPEALAAALERRPKFMYLLPNFQNPSGATWSLARRQAAVGLAAAHGIPIVEDDPYGQLRYEGGHLPSLMRLDRAASGTNVLYLSTFSKTLAPGVRLGWIIGPAEVIARLVQLKQSTDLHTSGFVQQVIYEVARGGFLDEHIRQLREAYGTRRDVMLEALRTFLPPEATWTHPEGGLFLWLRLPDGLDCHGLLTAALEQQVAFVPGTAFFADRDAGRRFCRLNFSNAQPEQIWEGIRRLGRAVEAQMAAAASPVPEPA